MSTIQKKRTATSRAARTTFSALAAAGVIALLAACGGAPASDDSSELKTGNEQAAYDDWQRDYNKCLSDEGIDMGAFETSAVDGGTATEDGSSGAMSSAQSITEGDIDIAAFEKASKACFDKLGEMPTPPGMPSPEEMQKSMLAFAKCMRDAGYDYPDPEISKDGSFSMQALAMDEFDPEVMNACAQDSETGMSISPGVTTGDAE